MSGDETSFLAAVRASPADDLPRLVYADWLEERDDPRGGLIRAEVEVARAVIRVIESRAPQPWNWPGSQPRVNVTLLGYQADPATDEAMILLARRYQFGETLDRAGAEAALTRLPRKIRTAEGGEAALWLAEEFRRAGGQVSLVCDPATWLSVADTLDGEGNPRGGVIRARLSFVRAAAAVVASPVLVERDWWRAARPPLRLRLDAPSSGRTLRIGKRVIFVGGVIAYGAEETLKFADHCIGLGAKVSIDWGY